MNNRRTEKASDRRFDPRQITGVLRVLAAPSAALLLLSSFVFLVQVYAEAPLPPPHTVEGVMERRHLSPQHSF